MVDWNYAEIAIEMRLKVKMFYTLASVLVSQEVDLKIKFQNEIARTIGNPSKMSKLQIQ